MAHMDGQISKTYIHMMYAQNILAPPPLWGLSRITPGKKTLSAYVNANNNNIRCGVSGRVAKNKRLWGVRYANKTVKNRKHSYRPLSAVI